MDVRTSATRIAFGLILAVPTGAVVGGVVAAGTATAATPMSCATDTGTGTLKPGISNTPAVQKATIKGKLGGCKGGVTSGTVSGLLTTTSKVSCATLGQSSVSKGTLTVVWNTKATSTIAVTATTTTTTSETGKVTKGLFLGETLSAVLTTTGAVGNCNPTPITSESYKGTWSLK